MRSLVKKCHVCGTSNNIAYKQKIRVRSGWIGYNGDLFVVRESDALAISCKECGTPVITHTVA